MLGKTCVERKTRYRSQRVTINEVDSKAWVFDIEDIVYTIRDEGCVSRHCEWKDGTPGSLEDVLDVLMLHSNRLGSYLYVYKVHLSANPEIRTAGEERMHGPGQNATNEAVPPAFLGVFQVMGQHYGSSRQLCSQLVHYLVRGRSYKCRY